jgi:hypothetical protein
VGAADDKPARPGLSGPAGDLGRRLLYGPTTDSGVDSYVLCEINVSAVWPYPAQAATTIAEAALARVWNTIASRG